MRNIFLMSIVIVVSFFVFQTRVQGDTVEVLEYAVINDGGGISTGGDVQIDFSISAMSGTVQQSGGQFSVTSLKETEETTDVILWEDY